MPIISKNAQFIGFERFVQKGCFDVVRIQSCKHGVSWCFDVPNDCSFDVCLILFLSHELFCFVFPAPYSANVSKQLGDGFSRDFQDAEGRCGQKLGAGGEDAA